MATLILFLLMGYGLLYLMDVSKSNGFKAKRQVETYVTEDDAEIYQNAAVAADAVTCSEIGMYL